ncbi:Pentatricopeptide repeat-containing protein [Forsythia ovata]|uniref:Pentatricopeptide repeat-containing protein n=1 Tax=Forsythia ovata TaxID=205694 RepID=A0ABD1QSY3_9LAMI
MFLSQLKKFHTTTPSLQKTVLYNQSVNATSILSSKKNSNSHFTQTDEKETNSYASALSNCVKTSNFGRARAIHARLIKTSCFALDSLYLHNHLINAYMKCGATVYGLQLFNEMPKKNVVSWTALIAGFVQKGFPMEAFSLFSHMLRSGIRPNEFSFVSALHTCSFSENLSLLHTYQVYAMIIRLGFESNVFLVNAFLTALISNGMLEEAMEVFEGCFQRDIVSWNTIFGGCLKFSCDNIPGFWHRMITEGVVPDEYTYSSVLTGMAEVSNLEFGLQVHARLVKSGHGSEMCVGNSLVDMYLKSQRLCDGLKAFEEIPAKDVCSWSQMAAGCLSFGEPLEVLRVIGKMRRAGVKPNKFTLATGLNACANLASLEEGQKVHTLRIKLGDDADVCVDNALLDMYAKCGYTHGASKVFQSMNERSVVSWTTMIMGYAQNGHAKEALEIFEEMRQEGVKPNYITLISVLYACSQGGFIDKSLEYFSSMNQEYGIAPGEDHYACMVNLLGREGRIKEAEDLILEMPFEPGVVIWQTLLGACRLHGDMDAAKRAAEHALALDQNDPSTYVLLSNTFAGFDSWNTSEILGQVRKMRDVKKKPGSSWLEMNRAHSLPIECGR